MASQSGFIIRALAENGWGYMRVANAEGLKSFRPMSAEVEKALGTPAASMPGDRQGVLIFDHHPYNPDDRRNCFIVVSYSPETVIKSRYSSVVPRDKFFDALRHLIDDLQNVKPSTGVEGRISALYKDWDKPFTLVEAVKTKFIAAPEKNPLSLVGRKSISGSKVVAKTVAETLVKPAEPTQVEKPASETKTDEPSLSERDRLIALFEENYGRLPEPKSPSLPQEPFHPASSSESLQKALGMHLGRHLHRRKKPTKPAKPVRNPKPDESKPS